MNKTLELDLNHVIAGVAYEAIRISPYVVPSKNGNCINRVT